MSDRDESKYQGYHYVIIHIQGPRTDEVTNVGLILFDVATGEQIAAKMDTIDRAIARGDICVTGERFSNYGYLNLLLANYPQSFPTMATLKKAQEGIGHCMSFITTSYIRGGIITHDEGLAGTLERVVQNIWDSFIVGRI